MIIVAEMYGITPKAKIENLFSESPVIALAKSPKSIFFNDITPGTGIVVPTIKMNKHIRSPQFFRLYFRFFLLLS